jgi:aerobic-type carbon monoxide dehydrogenase small subunit (CoxS/CutS family)
MILDTISLLKKNPDPSDEQIVEALNGHICRCCGYPKIVAAVHRAAEGGA